MSRGILAQTARMLGTTAAVSLAAGVAWAAAWIVVFLYGSSPRLLVWGPWLVSVLVLALSLRLRRRISPGGRWQLAYVILMLSLAMTAGAASGWLEGWWTTTPGETPRPGMAYEGHVARADGGTTFYHQSALSGSTLPVLLVLHGGPGSGSVSARAALGEALSGSLRTIFFDQRGVGRSSAARSFDLDSYVDDIERLRRSLGIESWYLFGISWGAALANEYAVRHPQRVEGVVTWGGLVSNELTTRSMLVELRRFYTARADAGGVAWCQALERQTSAYSRLQALRVMNAVNRARLKTVRTSAEEGANVLAGRRRAVQQWGYAASQTGTSLWATAATFMQNALESYDFRPRQGLLSMPALTLAGEQDPLLRSAEVASYAIAPPLRTLAWIPRSGHTLDRADAVAAAVVAFVRHAG